MARRIIDDAQARFDLFHIVQAHVAEDIDQAERDEAARPDAGSLVAEFEEDAEDRDHIPDQRNDLEGLFHVQRDQVGRFGLGCRQLPSERGGELLFEPTAHLGRCGVNLFGR